MPEPGVEAAVMHALARDPRFRPALRSRARGTSSPLTTELPTEPLLATAITEPLAVPHVSRACPGGSAWLWIAGAAAVALVAVILGSCSASAGAASGSKKPTPASDPGARARSDARGTRRGTSAPGYDGTRC